VSPGALSRFLVCSDRNSPVSIQSDDEAETEEEKKKAADAKELQEAIEREEAQEREVARVRKAHKVLAYKRELDHAPKALRILGGLHEENEASSRSNDHRELRKQSSFRNLFAR